MIYMHIAVLGFLVLIFIKSRNQKYEISEDAKSHKIGIELLYPMAKYIIEVLKLDKVLGLNGKIEGQIKKIYITKKPEKILEEYWHKKISIIILIIMLTNLFSIFYLINNTNPIIQNKRYLKRPPPGMGSENEEVNVYLKGEEEKSIRNFTVEVQEKMHSKEELLEMFKRSEEFLDEEILGENSSFSEIYYDLNLVTTIPDTSITVDWISDEFELLDSKGRINNENVGEWGREVNLKAKLSYDENELEYNRIIKIMPKTYTEEELIKQDLQRDIDLYSEKTRHDEFQELPNKTRGYDLMWESVGQAGSINLLVFALVLSIAMWFYQDQKLKDKIKIRDTQLLVDYPEVVNKFTLLMNAGMTLQQAWIKIVSDYKKKVNDKEQGKRFVYEEMIITSNELKLGIPEVRAYEEFGQRVGLLPYMKFSSLIAQNLKKGGQGLSKMLNHEAREAFELRKEMAKRQGEEASTKLLGPMIIILFVVLAIVLIPALSNFKIM